MPLKGSDHSENAIDEDRYFTSLSELDAWADKSQKKLLGVLPYTRRSKAAARLQQGKLLVCHDYKGGYTEKPSALSYTFNFWSACESFVYFAHHRVTIPPSGWISAAHRQGVKMLGTLIFEGSAEPDCLRLLFGRLPTSITGPALPSSPSAANSFPISPHYVRLLAQLARQRGFDGYLLNFECPLRGGPEQTRALSAWISLLRLELQSEIGPHAQVMWYDSVIYTGDLRWQDRLNRHNLPFFPPSTSFFTNYTWPPNYPALTADYFLKLQLPDKSLSDVYMGVDVWGRGSYGDGGFGSFRAMEQIAPKSLGLSVALFGQAWTWESEQDKPEWNWEAWWKYERQLWLGPEAGEVVPIPPMSELSLRKQDMVPGIPPPGPFAAVTSFFDNMPPPNPIELPFFTSFSPGVGRRWFIKGLEVMYSENGWTDVDKQGSLGNLVWPRPVPQWEDGGGEGVLPEAASSLEMSDAWLGGSSLRLSLSFQGDADAFFRCVWIPVQSLAITPGRSYDASIIYKTQGDTADLEIAISMRSPFELDISSMSSKDLPNGWTELHIKFTLQSETEDDIISTCGLIVGCAAEDPSLACNFSVLLGQLGVYPTIPMSSPQIFDYRPKVLWADYVVGCLTWEVSASFDPLPPASIVPRPADEPSHIWELLPASFFPKFMYFNLFVQEMTSSGFYLGPDKAEFIGTTGWDGRANRFYLEKKMMPDSLSGGGQARFYIQGVTDRGEVLDWTRGVYVDAKLQF